MSKKSEVIYKEIQARIAKSEVAGADETGCHVNGKKHRFHASSVINTTVKNGQDVFTAYKFWLCTKFYRPE
ncbi:hypothetical protein AGMMS50239_26850 [Bacteroidia bacterium]|nr:hypothetical protein AGMMS50239_26850 [Bacteroidia bacterium]GHV31776.1 hypothetical protein FACS1894177_06980 [Bacteroidia bacterium]